jgi:hypothetical protein
MGDSVPRSFDIEEWRIVHADGSDAMDDQPSQGSPPRGHRGPSYVHRPLINIIRRSRSLPHASAQASQPSTAQSPVSGDTAYGRGDEPSLGTLTSAQHVLEPHWPLTRYRVMSACRKARAFFWATSALSA